MLMWMNTAVYCSVFVHKDAVCCSVFVHEDSVSVVQCLLITTVYCTSCLFVHYESLLFSICLQLQQQQHTGKTRSQELLLVY